MSWWTDVFSNVHDPLNLFHGERNFDAVASNYIDPMGLFMNRDGSVGDQSGDSDAMAELKKRNDQGWGDGGATGSSSGARGEGSPGHANWSETNPPGGKSQSTANAQTNYVDYVKWKRKELESLIAKYREAYPKQIASYKESALSGLEQQKKPMWEGMFTNLDKRGLSDSSSFLGGAKTDLEKWMTSEKGTIEDTAQGMETTAQQAILQAIGKPDYAGVYNAWNDIDQKNMEYLTSLIGKTKMDGTKIDPTYTTDGMKV